jgi:cellulose synthase/poly-beta-1,6-N-acetylglucosamine synthase-like glycosyltransferase
MGVGATAIDAVVDDAMTVSVVIPTYGRAEHLCRCVDGVSQQTRAADEVLVVWRRGDTATAHLLAGLRQPGFAAVAVNEPAQAAAMAAGVRASTGNIIAFTDDDAVPRRDWLATVLRHFKDPAVGAVGGRDVIGGESNHEQLVSNVGMITSWGRLLGNHHRGVGPPREVAVLKGANMAFRRKALALPLGLRGEGAQIHQEVAICLWARRAGWKIVYDPTAIVDHYPAERLDADRRLRPELIAVRNVAYNYSFCLLSFEPGLYWQRALSGFLIGDKANPGLIRAAAAVPLGEREVLRRLLPSLSGHLEALVDIARGRRVEMVCFVE